MPDRDHKLTIVLTDDESATLNGIAEADGVSASDVVRLFIRKHGAELAPRVPVPDSGGRATYFSDPSKAPTSVRLRVSTFGTPPTDKRNKRGGK